MKFPTDVQKQRVIKTFQSLGFEIVREGNHIIMERKNIDGTITPLVLPNHNIINSGTLRSIVTQIGLTREKFLQAFMRN
jgi:predicted RNA binding protein YcfA (HicA-like mRNA interferase family)